jgi:hypothetical protein
MARYQHNVYACANSPRYVVFFDLQWQIIECQRLEPAADLRSAMTTTLNRLVCEGWQPEGEPTKMAAAVLNPRRRARRASATDGPSNFGFVFLNRNGTRRLLILTERDPYDEQPQTFSPFK